MPTFAQVTTGSPNYIQSIGVWDVAPDKDPDHYAVDTTANYYVNITAMNPQPGLGYETSDQGVTFSPPGPTNPIGNLLALQTKAQTALTNNQTYLGLGNPSNAQVAAQVAALTRQVNVLIRQFINRLDSTAGT